jgi:hypothetical protein
MVARLKLPTSEREQLTCRLPRSWTGRPRECDCHQGSGKAPCIPVALEECTSVHNCTQALELREGLSYPHISGWMWSLESAQERHQMARQKVIAGQTHKLINWTLKILGGGGRPPPPPPPPPPPHTPTPPTTFIGTPHSPSILARISAQGASLLG